MKVKCPLCEYMTDNVHSLFAHMLGSHCDDTGTFTGTPETPEDWEYACLWCPYSTKDFDELVVHLLQEHSVELEEFGKTEDEKNRTMYEAVTSRAKDLGILPDKKEEQEQEEQ